LEYHRLGSYAIPLAVAVKIRIETFWTISKSKATKLSPDSNDLKFDYAQVAQLVEQRTENPRVGGSNPPLGTIPLLNMSNILALSY
jgi:hypothetical protein